jgi:hypothetical protein
LTTRRSAPRCKPTSGPRAIARRTTARPASRASSIAQPTLARGRRRRAHEAGDDPSNDTKWEQLKFGWADAIKRWDGEILRTNPAAQFYLFAEKTAENTSKSVSTLATWAMGPAAEHDRLDRRGARRHRRTAADPLDARSEGEVCASTSNDELTQRSQISSPFPQ